MCVALAGWILVDAASAQAPAPPAAAPAQTQPPAMAPAAAAAPSPGAGFEPRVVRPREVSVITGSRFRVGNERYQIHNVRTPRPRLGECVMERLRGRRSRSALRRILSRGEIRIVPTGQVSPLGDKVARVYVNGQSVRRKLIDARAALPRRSESFNPWCISLRKPPA